MRIALNTNAFSIHPPEQMLRLTREAGYGWIELHPRPDLLPAHAVPRLGADRLAELKGWLRMYGLAVDSVELAIRIGSIDADERRASVEAVARTIEIAGDLGCQRLTSELNGTRRIADDHGRWMPDLTDIGCRDAFLRSIEALLPALERADAHISFECHPLDFIEDSNQTVDLLRAIDSRHIGYLFCTPHVYSMGGEIGPLVEYAGTTLTHVHIADTYDPRRIIVQPRTIPGLCVHQHFQPGIGDLDWASFFRALRAIGYDGTLSCNTLSQRDRAFEAARETREFLERQLAKPG